MVTAAELLKTLRNGGEISAESGSFDMREYEQRKADRYNRSVGSMPDYDCKLCFNRGDFMRITDDEGRPVEVHERCKCMAIRESIWRLKRSGLEKTVRDCTFEKFIVEHDWQKVMLDTAKAFLADSGDRWFYIGGQPGCGKTHICTAICRQYMYDALGVKYMTWRTDSVELKGMITDQDEYGQRLDELKRVDVLYIDDFFKPVRDNPPTGADIKLAYDIINYRYINRKKTIISSEKSAVDLLSIDEATGSRIYEMAKGYTLTIERGNDKNWRLREAGL